jgi:hypothetical protein
MNTQYQHALDLLRTMLGPQADFRRTCPGFGEGTYNAFLFYGASELFKRVSPGKFRLMRPFRHGL